MDHDETSFCQIINLVSGERFVGYATTDPHIDAALDRWFQDGSAYLLDVADPTTGKVSRWLFE